MTNEEWIEFLKQSIESHDRQLGELTEKVDKLADAMKVQAANIDAQTANIDKLVIVTNRDAEDIRRLARIAQAHQDRLERIDPAT